MSFLRRTALPVLLAGAAATASAATASAQATFPPRTLPQGGSPPLRPQAPQGMQPVPPAQPPAAPAPIRNPDVVNVTQQTVNGRVHWQLWWRQVPGAARYHLAGRTSADFRVVPANAGAGDPVVDLGPLAPGEYLYQVGTVVDPGGRETPGDQWTLVRFVVPPATEGRYRVSLNGFRVDRQTVDDLLHGDGVGDEVRFGAAWHRSDRTYSPNQPCDRVGGRQCFVDTTAAPASGATMTPVYGDAGRVPARIRVGSAGPTGGLRTGDIVPLAVNPAVPYGPHATRFPHVLWEGRLRNGREQTFLHVWAAELDDDNAPLGFRLTQAGCGLMTAVEHPAIRAELAASGVRAVRVLDLPRVPAASWCTYETPTRGWPGPGNRLIGLESPNDPAAFAAASNILVLTREKVESLLQGRAHAIVGVPIEDRIVNGNGTYTLFVLIERLP